VLVRRFHNAPEFARLVVPLLETSEAENNLPLGMISTIAAGGHHERVPFLAVVHSGPEPNLDTIAAIALRTPPFPVVVAFTPSASDPAVVDCLVRELHAEYDNDICGFNADARIAGSYAEAWSALTGAHAFVQMRSRIYRCTRVKPPQSVRGTARGFEPTDADVVRGFVSGFYEEALPDEYDPKRVEAFIERMTSAKSAQHGLLLWETDHMVVSMAAYAGATPHGIRVNAVYTPKEHRRQGFASACVAELTYQLLRGGREFCFLFTDTSNPTSNSIYQEIGYEPVSDHVYWKFEEEA
jgi:predicted GNAT family acetyltransferase